jgi:general secretion pathway protein M
MLRKFSKRERYGIYAACGAVCIFILIRFILFPVLDNRVRLKRTLQAKTRMLADMQRLQSEYQRITRQSEHMKQRFAGRTKGFTLFSFLDKLARDTGVKDNIAYMKPSTTLNKTAGLKISTIEMKLQSVALPKLTNYLYQVEASKNMVIIKRASFVRKGKEKGAIDVILQIETFEV